MRSGRFCEIVANALIWSSKIWSKNPWFETLLTSTKECTIHIQNQRHEVQPVRYNFLSAWHEIKKQQLSDKTVAVDPNYFSVDTHPMHGSPLCEITFRPLSQTGCPLLIKSINHTIFVDVVNRFQYFWINMRHKVYQCCAYYSWDHCIFGTDFLPPKWYLIHKTGTLAMEGDTKTCIECREDELQGVNTMKFLFPPFLI